MAGRQVWSELKAEGLVEDQPLKDALDGLDLPEIDTSALSGGDLSSLKPDLSSLKLPELPSEAPSFSAPKFEAPDFSSLKAPELPSFEKPDLSSFSAPDFSSQPSSTPTRSHVQLGLAEKRVTSSENASW